MPSIDGKNQSKSVEAFYVNSPLTGPSVKVGPIVDTSGCAAVTLHVIYYTKDSVGTITLSMSGIVLSESDDPNFATSNTIPDDMIIGDRQDFALSLNGFFGVYNASVGFLNTKRYVRSILAYNWTGSATPPPHFIANYKLYPSVVAAP